MQIIETCKEPRSFVVLDENGSMYRRSREHISKRALEESKEQINVCNHRSVTNEVDKNLVHDDISRDELLLENNNSKENEETYVTKRGREVKKPKRFYEEY